MLAIYAMDFGRRLLWWRSCQPTWNPADRAAGVQRVGQQATLRFWQTLQDFAVAVPAENEWDLPQGHAFLAVERGGLVVRVPRGLAGQV